MKANELRIGNWVKDSLGYLVIGVNAKVEFASAYEPIPLTPEILERLGFISNPYQDRYELGDLHFEYCAIRNLIWCEKYPHIKYVHRLQNLYFALTNDELTLIK